MKERFIAICLAVAMILSMVPATGIAYAAQSHTVIATGIEATGISIMGNGYCAYEVIDGYEITRKGVIAPSGKAVVTRDFGDDPVYMGVYGTRQAVGYGTAIIDLPVSTRHSADGETAWGDLLIYDTDGNLKGHVTDMIKSYAGLDRSDVVSASHAFWGNDGYLTVYASTAGGNLESAYIIDLRKMEICFSMQTYNYGAKEGAEIRGVNESLIPTRRPARKRAKTAGIRRSPKPVGWI